jgi:hypothetical protein
MSFPDRIISLELRSSKFGFAVLESPRRLLDWGVRSFDDKGRGLESAVIERIDILLAFYGPIIMIGRERKHHSAVQTQRFRAILTAIRQVTKQHSVDFTLLPTAQVRRWFASDVRITKHQLARIVADKFEELLQAPQSQKTVSE